MPKTPTRAEIQVKRPTRKQLIQWGVGWPPPKGWRKRLKRKSDLVYGAKNNPPAQRKGLEPGQLHPYWSEWRWDGEAFERA